MGKFITLIYALVGIPLVFLYLSNIGDYLADVFRVLYARTCMRTCDQFCSVEGPSLFFAKYIQSRLTSIHASRLPEPGLPADLEAGAVGGGAAGLVPPHHTRVRRRALLSAVGWRRSAQDQLRRRALLSAVGWRRSAQDQREAIRHRLAEELAQEAAELAAEDGRAAAAAAEARANDEPEPLAADAVEAAEPADAPAGHGTAGPNCVPTGLATSCTSVSKGKTNSAGLRSSGPPLFDSFTLDSLSGKTRSLVLSNAADLMHVGFRVARISANTCCGKV
ncbi:unnamed protein product [Protopolystoma xenopodis]|uniref:Potassium channel domain-containing protein n=1 Tax=Protopolystoma xenopodis TaxID=117903 RepID=A0A448XP82_9PLAT|nr:unnamed protein product [Protopolystoma xenopodis]